MKSCWSVIIIALFGVSVLPGHVIRVPLDQPTIQAGIDISAIGDTVLVQPGTYMENINFNGKSIVVSSLYMITGLHFYIENTIIDGGSNGTVVTIVSGADSTTMLCGFTITNGYALLGGGIDCHEAHPRLSHLIVVNNKVESYDQHWTGTLGKGGGIHVSHSRAAMEDILLAKNQSDRWGGAVCVTDSKINMTHVTMTENSAAEGGGIFFENDSGSLLTNSIVWANQAQSVLVSGGEPVITYSDIEGGWSGAGNININPFFFDQEMSDYRLSDSSPCIGKGDMTPPSVKDLAGNPRPDPPGTKPDLGAYESHLSDPRNEPNITVDKDTLNFGKLFIGDSTRIQMRVRNTGSQDLQIFNIETSPQVFGVFPGSAGIDPLESEIFTVTFKPSQEAQYKGTLILNSNDPDQSQLPIKMIGQGLRPPKIQVEPDSLVVTLAEGTVSHRIVTISNQGYSDLDFAVYPGKSSHSDALQFDGIDDYVEVPNDPSLNLSTGLTIEAWIYSYHTDGPRVIVSKWNDPGNDWSYIFKGEGEKLSIELSKNIHNDLCALQSRSSIPMNTWIHVATTFDGGTVKLYMVGREENTMPVNGTLDSSTTHLLIGAVDGSGGHESFSGIVDEVRIWNYARSAQEINDFMYTELSGSEPGLAAYWRFNDGAGNRTFDSSPRENDGDLHGDTDWIPSEAPLWNHWLTCSPQKAVCNPNSSQQISISIDATQISPTNYNTNIMIISNDPSQSIIFIPIKIDIVSRIEQEFTSALPQSFALHQNYPNPFNLTTAIEFALPKSAFVTLTVYNLLGEQVATLIQEKHEAGIHRIQWDAAGLTSGVYLYRLKAGEFVQMKKLIFIQ